LPDKRLIIDFHDKGLARYAPFRPETFLNIYFPTSGG